MRQRKVKNAEERINALGEFSIENPKECKGKWNKNFEKEQPIYLELGCGKGQFLLSKGAVNPKRNYIGVEGQETVVLRALEKTAEMGVENVKFVNEFISDIKDYFEDGELAGIYLNFSDPWPKARHEKRRLTHRNYLLGYKEVLNTDGALEFKTDNDGLFEFTLGELADLKEEIEVLEMTRDLHNEQDNLFEEARCTTTEYEDKFRTLGKNINYVRFRFIRKAV